MKTPGRPASPRVASITPLPALGRVTRGRATVERARVRLDDGSELDVALEVVERLGLRSGDPVDARLRAELEDADLRWRARDAALSLLAHRARSRSELAGRLTRKGFPGAVVAPCLDRLEEEGLLDDDAFARAFVADRLRLRPRGRRGLVAELRRRGVAEAAARGAVDDVFRHEEADETSLAVDAALAWLRKQGEDVRRELAGEPFSHERERARRRLYGYLARRGFGGAALSRAMEVAGEAAERP